MKVSSLCKLREFFFKSLNAYMLQAPLVARSAHTPASPCVWTPPFRHHSVVCMHTSFHLLASSTMPPPPPQHKELFSLRQPDEYMRFSTGDEKLTQVLPGPPAKIPHGSLKWLNEEGTHTHREEQQRELCLAAHLPSALLSPSGSHEHLLRTDPSAGTRNTLAARQR